MSKYTTELRYVLETYAGLEESEGNDKVEDIITSALPKLFDFVLPIYDNNYSAVLERKICRHFYTREIGYETVGRFKLALRTKLIEILPYYNQLYESALLNINPLRTYTVDKTHVDSGGTTNTSDVSYNRTDTSNSNATNIGKSKTSTTGADKQRFSDTPNGTLADIENNTYLTNATLTDTTNSGNSETVDSNVGERKDKTTGGSLNTDTFTTTMQYVERVSGINGISESKLLKQYRETFLNIDMMIIDELEPLFMQIW